MTRSAHQVFLEGKRCISSDPLMGFVMLQKGGDMLTHRGRHGKTKGSHGKGIGQV